MPIDSNIRKIIKENGHITIDVMMDQIISHGPNAYYKRTSELSAGGDFVTAPVISQLFGEMVGLWVTEQWQKLGSPTEYILLEMGPGTGELMRDVIRTVSLTPAMKEATRILMLDINPHFIAKQKEILSPLHSNISWLDTLEEFDTELPLIVISNEFFDALPVKQYKKYKNTWHESILVCDPGDSRLKYDRKEVNKNMQIYLKNEHPQARDGAVFEESVASLQIIRMLGSIINKNTGSFLAIDYGYNIHKERRTDRQYKSSLIAIKDHKFQSMIDTLGEADLSADVDFQALKYAAKSVGIKHGIIDTQANFLKAYGIMIRKTLLQEQHGGEIAESLEEQVRRLTESDQMGKIFKVLQFWNYPN